MKKILFLFLLLGMVQGIWAQPEARRQAAAQKKAAQQNGDTPTLRAQISFPTALPMDEDVVWRRDIYRELDLNNEANAALYYPVEPKGNQMNLFATIFRLMMTGKVTVFQYRMDGNESFAAADRVDPKSFLDNYHIYYEKQANGRIKLDNSDIPSREVKSYYIKESSFFDQRSATFHTKVLALCPIMTREDDFGDGGTRYPLFWVKYDDLAPYLTRQQVMTSNLNNAVVMSIDDYLQEINIRVRFTKPTICWDKPFLNTVPRILPWQRNRSASRQNWLPLRRISGVIRHERIHWTALPMQQRMQREV